jgi:hypothetical protein
MLFKPTCNRLLCWAMLLGLLALAIPLAHGADPALALVIKTDNPGSSSSTQFTLPFTNMPIDVTVDWGDGSSSTPSGVSSITHTYASAGTYTVKVTQNPGGTFGNLRFLNEADATKVLQLSNWGSVAWTSMFGAFFGCSNMSITATDHATAATGDVTDFSYAWYQCSSMTGFPLIDTGSGTSFFQAWFGCSGLTAFPLIDTANGTDFGGAWSSCSGLTSFPHIDTSKGTHFGDAWKWCSGLTSFPALDMSNGSGFGFIATWQGCSGLTSFPLIDTSGGTSFIATWYQCRKLTEFPAVDVSGGTSFMYAWGDCQGLTSFPALNTGNGQDFKMAWVNCTGLTSFPALDTSKGLTFESAWNGCTSLTSFPLIDTGLGTNFLSAWYNCPGLTAFPLLDTSSGTDFSYAWNSCYGLTSFPALDTANGTNFASAWVNCFRLTSFPLIDTGKGINFAYTWSGCSGLTSFPLLDTGMGTIFAYTWNSCNRLTSFPALDLASGADFQYTWSGCVGLNGAAFPAVDLSGMTNGEGCFWGVALSTASYSALLNALAAGNNSTDVVFDGGLSIYHAGAAVARNTTLIGGRDWTITDAGTTTVLGLQISTYYPGSSNNLQFTLPFRSNPVGLTIDWGDGASSTPSGVNTITHTYAESGAYVLQLTLAEGGTFGDLHFNGGGDCRKVIALTNWGALAWSSLNGSFSGCGNLVITAQDSATAPTGTVTDFAAAWKDCLALTSFPLLDTASGADFSQAWSGCTGLDGGSFPAIDMRQMTDGSGCFAGVTLSTASYTAMINRLAATNSHTDVVFHGGGSKYGLDALDAHETTLKLNHGWTITDGGLDGSIAGLGLSVQSVSPTAVAFNALFSEPVTGFTADDAVLAGAIGTSRTISITNPSDDGMTYLVAISIVGGSPGEVTLSIPAGSIATVDDAKPNLLVAATAVIGSGVMTNDAFAAPLALVGTAATAFGDNHGATRQTGEPSHAQQSGGTSIWWTWTAPVSGMARIDTIGSGFDTLLGVYTGGAVNALVRVASGDNASQAVLQSRCSFRATAGQTYRIAVDGKNRAVGAVSLHLSQSGYPVNDNFANAIVLVGVDGDFGAMSGSEDGSNVGATFEASEVKHAKVVGGTSIWYRWTAPAKGTLILDTSGSAIDTLLESSTGPRIGKLQVVGFNDAAAPGDPASHLMLRVSAGTTYNIVIDGKAGVSGDVHLDWSFVPTPLNDNLASATILSDGNGTLDATLAGATRQGKEPLHAGITGGHSIWYAWMAPSSGLLTVDTLGSPTNTLIGLYTGSKVDELKVVGSNDDASGAVLQSQASVPVVGGKTYRIAIDGKNGAAGPVTVNWSFAPGGGG